jgi:hypothetical protein
LEAPVGGQFTSRSISGPAGNLTGAVLNPVSLAVEAGDRVGVTETAQSSGGAGVYYTSVTGAFFRVFGPGFTAANQTGSGFLGGQAVLQYNADLVLAPVITGLSPASGPAAGGSAVTITGGSLDGASAVRFGSVPSPSFTAAQAQITATAPAGTPGRTVDVTVEGPGGTSEASAATKYTYTGCTVPNIKGEKLKRAKKKLGNADCRIGKRKGKKGGEVRKQYPPPGTVLPVGGSVNVKLG